MRVLLRDAGCDCGRCVRKAIRLDVRERTYPLVVPLVVLRPRAAWTRMHHPFAVRWGYA